MSWLVDIIIVLGVIHMSNVKYHTFRKVCFVSAKPISNHILFSFRVLSDCSAKNKHHIKRLL